MPRGFVVGWNVVNVNIRKKASVARADKALRRMVGEEVGYMGPGPARLYERSPTCF